MNPQGRWKLRERRDGKKLFVDGPCSLEIAIDYDDVDHETVDREVRHLLDLLNTHWPELVEAPQQ